MTAGQVVGVIAMFSGVIILCLALLYIVEFLIATALDIPEYQKGIILITPKLLYQSKTLKLNKFSCWLIFIFFRIINPVGTILFLFTIGRKTV